MGGYQKMSSLVLHAKNELQRAGLFDEDADYGGELGKAILCIVEKFSEQGHSGGSAEATVEILSKLLRFQPLTPITSNASEWFDVSDVSGSPMWQSTRDPRYFSTDVGQSWYNVDDPNSSRKA